MRAKLSSEPGKTQLNQGFLTHPRSNGKATPRGDGFELRTDQHGAIRAAHGLLITTEALIADRPDDNKSSSGGASGGGWMTGLAKRGALAAT